MKTPIVTLFMCAAAASAATIEPKVPFVTKGPNILVCMADDWGWPPEGFESARIVQTPNFDRVAKEGFLFTQAYSAAPSCTPSRAAILTGIAPHRLAEGANLHGFLPHRFATYPDLLEQAGYTVGFMGKGWGPGNFKAGGRTRNPAGPNFKSFAAFLETVPADRPFCFWFGSQDPHRPYEKGAGQKAGMDPAKVRVPPYLPDTPEVRSDILDYYAEVQRFDENVGELLQTLEASGRGANTLVVISGDNGWPFPRGKANLYDAGTRQPMAIRWPAKFKGGKKINAFVSLTDLAPTFIEVAGLKPFTDMTSHSFLPLLEGRRQSGRDAVLVERERHANVRKGDLSYPARAIRTKEFLYIRNLRPDRWPAGDPQKWFAVGPFGDCDGSPTKDFILDHRDDGTYSKFFQLAFAKRPAEELYDLAKDPFQLVNVAAKKQYASAKKKLRERLDQWMKTTLDPRATADDDRWDTYPYFGEEGRTPRK